MSEAPKLFDLDQLHDMAEEYGLEGYQDLSEPELLKALIAKQREILLKRSPEFADFLS